MLTITEDKTTNKYDKSHRRVAKSDLVRAVKLAAEKESLGKDANTVGVALSPTYKPFRLLDYARSLLKQYNIKNTKDGYHRTRYCHAVRAYQAETITIKLNSDTEHSKASLAGVQTCGSVWSCPVCSKRKAVKYAAEISKALEWAEANKHTPVMLTLTARHNARMSLDNFKSKFKTAYRRMQQRTAFRRLKRELGIDKTIKAIEVPHGDSGWHYHNHIMLFIPNAKIMDVKAEKLDGWRDELAKIWLDCLSKVGLSARDDIACHISYHGNVKAEYLSKLGIETSEKTNANYELSAGANKTEGGRKIWAILASAMNGNKQSEKLYLEYVIAMQGDDWISWSDGFKVLVGADEISDLNSENKMRDWLDVTDEEFAPVRKLNRVAELLQVAADSRNKGYVESYLKSLEVEWLERENSRLKPTQDNLDLVRQQYSRALGNSQLSFIIMQTKPTAKNKTQRQVALGKMNALGDDLRRLTELVADVKTETYQD